jgi:hypothetical protein
MPLASGSTCPIIPGCHLGSHPYHHHLCPHVCHGRDRQRGRLSCYHSEQIHAHSYKLLPILTGRL